MVGSHSTRDYLRVAALGRSGTTVVDYSFPAHGHYNPRGLPFELQDLYSGIPNPSAK